MHGDKFGPYGYEDFGGAMLDCEIDESVSRRPRDFMNNVGRSRRGEAVDSFGLDCRRSRRDGRLS